VLIDWFTVGAQAINFLILVWLLRRYLYRPVLAAIYAREKKVAGMIADATAQEARARVAGEALRQRNEAFDRDRDGLMRSARDQGAAEHERLFESARQDSQLLRAKLTQTLAAERAALGHQLATRTQEEVFAVAHKALSDLAGASLEDRMIEVFIARMRELSEPIVVGAAPARAAAVRERLGADATVRFETAPELICGVELTVDGVKLPWSVADYLSSLAQNLAALAATDLVAEHAP
jgi:F-type H+-transporting ATPase subunit b